MQRKCKCGCGAVVKEGRTYVHGHNAKGKKVARTVKTMSQLGGDIVVAALRAERNRLKMHLTKLDKALTLLRVFERLP